nr:hypothetical protein [Moritella viscosa]SHO01188.1 Putative uncharacterized protein [Moritella viscosa]
MANNLNAQQHVEMINQLQLINSELKNQSETTDSWISDWKKSTDTTNKTNEQQQKTLQDALKSLKGMSKSQKSTADPTNQTQSKSKTTAKAKTDTADTSKLKMLMDQFSSFSGVLMKTIGIIGGKFKNAFVMATSVFNKSIDVLSSAIKSIQGMIGSALKPIGYAAATATAALTATAVHIWNLNEGYNQLIQSGFAFKGGLEGMQTSLNNTGLNLNELSSVIGENSALFTSLGADGLQDFTDQLGDLRKSGALAELGLTSQQGAEQLAGFLEQQRLSGDLDAMANLANTEAQKTYMNDMTLASRTLGVSVKDLQKSFAASFQTANLATYYSGMTDETRLQAQSIMEIMKDVPDKVKEDMLRVSQGLQPLNDEYVQMIQQNKAFKKANDHFVKGVQDNTLSLSGFKDVAKASIKDATDARNQAVNNQYATAQANNAVLNSFTKLAEETPTTLQRDDLQKQLIEAKTQLTNVTTGVLNGVTMFFSDLFQGGSLSEAFSTGWRTMMGSIFEDALTETGSLKDEYSPKVMLGKALAYISDGIKSAMTAVFSLVSDNFGSWVKSAFSNIADLGKQLIPMIGSVVKTTTANFDSWISSAFKTFQDLGTLISPVITNVLKFVSDNFDKWISSAFTVISDLGSKLVPMMKEMFLKVTAKLGDLSSKININPKMIADLVTGGITTLITGALNIDWLNLGIQALRILDGVVAGVVIGIGKGFGLVWDKGLQALGWDGVKQSIIGLWDSITGGITGAVSGVIGAFSDFGSDVLRNVKGMIRSAMEFVPDALIPDSLLDWLNLPEPKKPDVKADKPPATTVNNDYTTNTQEQFSYTTQNTSTTDSTTVNNTDVIPEPADQTPVMLREQPAHQPTVTEQMINSVIVPMPDVISPVVMPTQPDPAQQQELPQLLMPDLMPNTVMKEQELQTHQQLNFSPDTQPKIEPVQTNFLEPVMPNMIATQQPMTTPALQMKEPQPQPPALQTEDVAEMIKASLPEQKEQDQSFSEVIVNDLVKALAPLFAPLNGSMQQVAMNTGATASNTGQATTELKKSNTGNSPRIN